MIPSAVAARVPSIRLRLPRAVRQPLVFIGLVVVIAWILVAIVAPVVAPYDPLAQGTQLFTPPSSQHWLGTDELGRDVLSRLLWGARVSVPLSILLVAVSLAIGAVLGGVAGYMGGWVDEVIMRAADLVLAIPAILLAMAVVGALGPGLLHAVLALVLVSWPRNARVVRGLVRTTMESEFVAVARLLGASTFRALALDVLPNIAGPVVVLAALDVGTAILLLSGLSFLGLGAQPPTAEWGSMVADGAVHFSSWWLGVFAGLAIVSVALAFNYLGDGLRDAFDPKAMVGEVRAA